MTTARREYFLLVAGLTLLIITGVSVYYFQRAPNRSRDMAEVTQLVTTFASYEKSISPLGLQRRRCLTFSKVTVCM